MVPIHILGNESKTGKVPLLLTTTVIVAVVAQNEVSGVKVYVVVAILFGAGDQVPLIPFKEVVGKGFKASP